MKMLRSAAVQALLCSACVPVLCVHAGAQSQPSATVQLPADRQALKTARGEKDPTRKLKLLRQFVQDFPDSNQLAAAHKAIFTTLVASFPDRDKEIRKEGEYRIHEATTPEAKADIENGMAYTLAEAGTNGVALSAAEAWSIDSVHHSTEAELDQVFTSKFADLRPPTTPEQRHEFYAHLREARLQTLGEVYLHEGKLEQARQTVAECVTLNPTDGGLYDTRGMIAYAEHNPAVALDNLEQAYLYGGISARSEALMKRLYSEAHGGSAGLAAHIDARYREVYPAAVLPIRAPIPGGHTVLVELFTGSGCEPCVGADLAIDDALIAYPGHEIVALEFDQHIPLPDPLANPDGIQRAGYYGVQYTPWLVIDGAARDLNGFGGDRGSQLKMYDQLSHALDSEIAASYTVGLSLTSAVGADGVIAATATVHVGDPAALATALQAAAVRTAPDAAAVQQQAEQIRGVTKTRGTAETAPVATPVTEATPGLTVNFALAEDDVRYSGENGLRFHRMVVRAVSKPSDAATSVDLHAPTTANATFNPAAISTSLSHYLESFAQHSERFGSITFLSTDTSISPEHLYVVAWVADPVTRQIVQAAIVPVQSRSNAVADLR